MSQELTPEEHVKRGIEYIQQDQDENAIREFEAALHGDPQSAEAHCGLGSIYLSQQRVEEAIHEFEDTLRLNPNHANARKGLGSAYVAQERAEEAMREFETVLSVDPNDARAHRLLGIACLAQNKGVPDDRAISEFESAVKLDPNDAKAHYFLAFGYTRKGRWEEGYREGELAEKLGSTEATEWLLKGTNRLIDKIQSLTLECERRPSDDAMKVFDILVKSVSDNLHAIDARFFSCLNQRIAQGKEGATLEHALDLLFTAVSKLLGGEAKLTKDLIALTDKPQCTEREIEAYLQQANEKSNFAFYVVVIGELERLHKFREDRGETVQTAQVQMAIDVASRLAPQAVPVAEQYYQWMQNKLAHNRSMSKGEGVPTSRFGHLKEETMSFLFGQRKRTESPPKTAEEHSQPDGSESGDAPVTLSRQDKEIIALADALLDSKTADAARTQLAHRGKSAGRVLALLLAGRVMQSKWWYWATFGDDMCLEYLWKLEEALVAIGPEAAPFVRPLMHHRIWTIKFMAINTIGDLRDRESLSDLLNLLEKDPSAFRMAMAAIEAVGKIGDPTAIPRLEKVFPQVSEGDKRLITQVIEDLQTQR